MQRGCGRSCGLRVAGDFFGSKCRYCKEKDMFCGSRLGVKFAYDMMRENFEIT